MYNFNFGFTNEFNRNKEYLKSVIIVQLSEMETSTFKII